jgi:hypothetical protein
MDLFVVPTIGFDLLYTLIIMRLDPRDLVWINVTAHPTAEWVARQITEAFPWDGAPRYMIRDRDRIYGTVVTLAERLCRTADRIDPARVFGSRHCFGRGTSAPNSEKLCGLLQWRENASVSKQRCAGLSAGSAIRRHKLTRPLGGLHHRYARV